jgi:hypothetical protein
MYKSSASLVRSLYTRSSKVLVVLSYCILAICWSVKQLTVDKNGQRHFSQRAWIKKSPTTSITAQVTP